MLLVLLVPRLPASDLAMRRTYLPTYLSTYVRTQCARRLSFFRLSPFIRHLRARASQQALGNCSYRGYSAYETATLELSRGARWLGWVVRVVRGLASRSPSFPLCPPSLLPRVELSSVLPRSQPCTLAGISKTADILSSSTIIDEQIHVRVCAR